MNLYAVVAAYWYAKMDRRALYREFHFLVLSTQPDLSLKFNNDLPLSCVLFPLSLAAELLVVDDVISCKSKFVQRRHVSQQS
jgi:hypothetical protein